jgi:hypothetical protein
MPHFPRIFKRHSTKDLKEKQKDLLQEPIPEVPPLPTTNTRHRKLSLPVLPLSSTPLTQVDLGVLANGVASPASPTSDAGVGPLTIPTMQKVLPEIQNTKEMEIWAGINSDHTTKGERILNQIGGVASK